MPTLAIVINSGERRGFVSAVLPHTMDPGSAIRGNLKGKWAFIYLLDKNPDDMQALMSPLEEDLPEARESVPKMQRRKNTTLNVRKFSIDIDNLPVHTQGDITRYVEFTDPKAYKITVAQLTARLKSNQPK